MNRGKKWFSEKLWKHFVLENFWSESFSIRTSCIESSRFRARVAKGRPAFRDRITRRNPRVQNRISKGRSGLRKSKKYFRLIMIRVTWIVEKSGFQKNFEKFCLRKFLVRVILDTYLLYRELPLPSSCCKGEACLPRSHYRGEPRVQNCVLRPGVGVHFEIGIATSVRLMFPKKRHLSEISI